MDFLDNNFNQPYLNENFNNNNNKNQASNNFQNLINNFYNKQEINNDGVHNNPINSAQNNLFTTTQSISIKNFNFVSPTTSLNPQNFNVRSDEFNLRNFQQPQNSSNQRPEIQKSQQIDSNTLKNANFNEPNIFPKNNFFDDPSNNFDKITDA